MTRRFTPKGPSPRAKTRTELFGRLGLLKIVEPLTRRAFEEVEAKLWRERHGEAPHGKPWYTSFHASQFPGADPRACGRYQQYVLLDDPGNEATPRKLRGQGEMGQAIEDMLVSRWGEYGVLLLNDDGKKQIGFEDPEFWLTGSADAPILPEGWKRPHLVEVKSKAADVIKEMQQLKRGPDEKHVSQIKTYIGFLNEQAYRWPELEPCIDGTLYYCSRDDPSQTFEFFFSLDPKHMETGRKKIAEARDAFIAGDLLPHPFGGKEWSKPPCQYCKYKKFTCKPDDKAEVTRLRESHSLARSKEIYGDDYDYDAARRTVLDRWGAEDQEDTST